MACAIKESVKNLLFFLISKIIFFDLSCCFILMVEGGSILYARRSLLSKRKKYFEQGYFKRKKTGNILLRSLRSVDRSYSLLPKMVYISQFKCFSKAVSNDFCNPIKIKRKNVDDLLLMY